MIYLEELKEKKKYGFDQFKIRVKPQLVAPANPRSYSKFYTAADYVRNEDFSY